MRLLPGRSGMASVLSSRMRTKPGASPFGEQSSPSGPPVATATNGADSISLRVNGRAAISIEPALMQSFAVNGKLPRCVLIVHVESVYFHCSKAIVRSKLWDAETKIDRKGLPSTGTIVAELSQGKLGGEAYDRAMPERIKAELY